jgi:hypothetical protein
MPSSTEGVGSHLEFKAQKQTYPRTIVHDTDEVGGTSAGVS